MQTTKRLSLKKPEQAKGGRSIPDVAKIFGVAPVTVTRWIEAYRRASPTAER